MKKLKNVMIEIPQTEKYLKASREISDFIETLTLTDVEHSQLINKLLDYTQEVRKDAFSLGIIERFKRENKPN